MLLAVVLGCAQQTAPRASRVDPASATPTSAPTASVGSTSPAAGVPAWTVAEIEQPSAVTQASSLPAGYHCSPCHPVAASQFLGGARVGTGWVAVGLQQPPATGIAFSSADGTSWIPTPGFSTATGTGALAVAGTNDRTVIVGSDPHGAAAWTSRGSGPWTSASGGELAGPRGATAMTSVVASDRVFIGGGYRDDPARDVVSAAAWRSEDGVTWRRDVAGDELAGGRILGVAARSDTVVAVGTSGSPTYGPAAAWVSVRGEPWRRATLPDGGTGVMRAVSVAGGRFVAVGYDGDDRGARVWLSDDGLAWTLASDQPSLTNDGNAVRMQAVAADAKGLVAGGWRADAANGSAAPWTSTDGERWEQLPWLATFSGGQITAIASDSKTAVAVGRTGYPDNNQATAWVTSR